MRSLKILDVTLRDGGCVNDFNFGIANMDKILKAQEDAGIEIIELGYIDEKKGSINGRTQYVSDTVIPQTILKSKKENVIYVVMIDYGKFDVDKLEVRNSNSVDGIRLAFHKKDVHDIVNIGRKIMDKGYLCFIQPMLTLRYTDAELLELIETVNVELADAAGFYIVDSFGEMRPNDMNRILNLVDYNLNMSIPLGFHSHNNLQMSYSNSIEMLKFPTNRDMMLDCSIMGMGKGAGNLNTELLVEHLNLFYGKKYNITPLLDVIDKVINQLHSEFYWGYAPEYYLSAVNQCTPSYASFFYNKHMLPIDQVGKLLSMISLEKRNSFDKEYAEELYRNYNKNQVVDDSQEIEELRNILCDKKVLLIAPGKSIPTNINVLEKIARTKGVIVIGLNVALYINDYIVVTRKDLYVNVVNTGKKILACSNIATRDCDNVYVLNYSNWIDVDDETHDSASVIAFNLLKECGVKEIMLAGFDGFSVDITENYYDSNMRYPVSIEQADSRNNYYKKLISKMKRDGICIQFITPSKYE